jgi:hypothetical protein
MYTGKILESLKLLGSAYLFGYFGAPIAVEESDGLTEFLFIPNFVGTCALNYGIGYLVGGNLGGCIGVGVPVITNFASTVIYGADILYNGIKNAGNRKSIK